MKTSLLSRALRGSALAGGLVGVVALASCTEREPTVPDRPLFDHTTNLVPVEVKVQSGQCPVEGTTVTMVNAVTGHRYFAPVRRNIAMVNVEPGASYIIHWTPRNYSDLAAGGFGEVTPWGEQTFETTLGTTTACGPVLLNFVAGNNSVPLTTGSYFAALSDPNSLFFVSGPTKTQPLTVNSANLKVRVQLFSEGGDPLPLQSKANIYRVQRFEEGKLPAFFTVNCASASPPDYCLHPPGLNDAYGLVGTDGVGDINNATPGQYLVEMKGIATNGKKKVFTTSFTVAGDQSVPVVERDPLAFTFYVFDNDNPGSPNIREVMPGWTTDARGATTDFFQAAANWTSTDGTGRFTLKLITNPGEKTSKSYSFTGDCSGPKGLCVLGEKAPGGTKPTVTGAFGSIIFTVELKGVTTACLRLESRPVGTPLTTSATDLAPNANVNDQECATLNGGRFVDRSKSGGNTFASPF